MGLAEIDSKLNRASSYVICVYKICKRNVAAFAFTILRIGFLFKIESKENVCAETTNEKKTIPKNKKYLAIKMLRQYHSFL